MVRPYRMPQTDDPHSGPDRGATVKVRRADRKTMTRRQYAGNRPRSMRFTVQLKLHSRLDPSNSPVRSVPLAGLLNAANVSDD